MKNRKLFSILFLLILGLSFLHGQSREDFTAMVNFGINLETLSKLASDRAGFFSDDAPLVILTGSVASRVVLRPGPEDYLAEIELVDGRWEGLEEVLTFRCVVRFEGPEYETFVPAGRSRRPPEDEIPLNASIMVIGKPVEVRRGPSGNEAVLAGYFVRVLDE